MPEDVAIVGSGLVGSAWALVFARAGSRVRLYDQEASQLAAAEARIAANAREMVGHGLLDDAPSVLARIESCAGLEDAVEGVSYVQESVFEDAEVKRAFYRKLDAAVGSETIIGSSSSGIPASVFTEGLACAPRCLIAHPINPPYVIPLVEICPSPWTDPAIVDRVWALMSDAGMAPVRCPARPARPTIPAWTTRKHSRPFRTRCRDRRPRSPGRCPSHRRQSRRNRRCRQVRRSPNWSSPAARPFP